MTVYLVLPADHLGTFGRVRLLIQQAITVNARNIEIKPDKPILFLLDEMEALGWLTKVEAFCHQSKPSIKECFYALRIIMKVGLSRSLLAEMAKSLNVSGRQVYKLAALQEISFGSALRCDPSASANRIIRSSVAGKFRREEWCRR